MFTNLLCFIFVGAFLALIFLIGYIGHRIREKRAGQMKEFAARNGWHYYDIYNFPFLRELSDYSGKTRTGLFGDTIENPLLVPSRNVVLGTHAGREFGIFEQTYTTGAHNRHHDVTQTLFAVQVADLNLPVFCLEPESLELFTSSVLSRMDIDFPSHPDFSRKYRLYGQEPQRIAGLFRPPVLNFYEKMPLFTTIAGGKYLVIYQRGAVFGADQLPAQLNFVYGLAELFKNRS